MKVISPIDQTDNVSLLKTIQSSQIIESWKKSFSIDISCELKNRREIYHYQCNSTHLKFFIPSDLNGSEQLYQQLEKFSWYYMDKKWEHDTAIEDISTCKKVIEVGCGQGAFVKRLCMMNLDACGIELNSSAVEFALSENIPVTQQNVHELARKHPSSFDAVCSFQVLEHVPYPKEFLEDLTALLKPRGRLILAVPNSETFTRFNNNDLLDQPPHHVTQWCRRSFESLTSILPLKLKHFKTEPLADYHVNWYLSIQSSRLGRFKILERAAKKIGNILIKPILLRSPKLRKKIMGHTLYVCFEKVG